MNKIKLYWDLINIGLISLAAFLIIGIMLSLPLWLLWNWLMPYIFGLPTITILQAFGLSALTTLLSPKTLDLVKKNNVQSIPDVEMNDKLNKALDDIQSQFKA